MTSSKFAFVLKRNWRSTLKQENLPTDLRGHCAFVGVGQAQNRGLIEVSTKNLQANGKLLAGLVASAPVHIRERACIASTVAVADSIEARKIRGRLRRGHDVIRRNGVRGVRQRYGYNLTAETSQLLKRSFHCFPHGAVQTFAQVFFGYTDFQSTNRLLQLAYIVRHRDVGGS